MTEEIEDIKERHKGDILTLWKIYNSDKPFYDNFYFKFSIITTFITSLGVLCFKSDIYRLIFSISDFSIGALPTLLGFNLGAYILIVGFGSSDILAIITRPLEKQNNYSFYQKLNGVLGISVIVQIVTLFFAFVLKVWKDIQIDYDWNIECIILPSFLNIIIFFIIMFLVTYSLLLLINVVKHVFMFAQTIHFFIYKKEIDKNKDE